MTVSSENSYRDHRPNPSQRLSLSSGQFISHTYAAKPTRAPRRAKKPAIKQGSPSDARPHTQTSSSASDSGTTFPPKKLRSPLKPTHIDTHVTPSDAAPAPHTSDPRPPKPRPKPMSAKPKRFRIPDPPPFGTFSTFRPPRSRKTSEKPDSDDPPQQPEHTVALSITELDLFGAIAPQRMYARHPLEPPEPPMTLEEWRAAADRRRARKFERALRTRDHDDAIAELPLDIVCAPLNDVDIGRTIGLAAPSLGPTLTRISRTRTWVASSVPTSPAMQREDPTTSEMDDVIRRCEDIDLSSPGE